MLLRHMLRLYTASKEQTDENGIPLPRTRRVVTHALLDSEKLDKAINVREARIRLHRSNEEITPEELRKRRQLYGALHKLRAVRIAIALRTPTHCYLH
jgi:hypothetical protein